MQRGRLLPSLGLATPLAAPIVWRLSPALALGAMAASHLSIVYGTLRANNQWFGPVATRFVPAGNEVWLTIDDGPDPSDTPRILDLLDASGARATFFVCGDRVRAYPHLAAEIVRRGHSLANHTYSHPQHSFWCLPPWRIAREMDGCNAAVREASGAAPSWFRAPVGMVNPFVHPVAQARGMRLIGWSARGFDGISSRADPAAVVRRILAGLRPGAIILMHEGRRGPGGEPLNVEGMEGLLAALGARSWRAVVPSEAQLR